MGKLTFREKFVETGRHKTAYLETGPEHGPLMIFIHGWPELGFFWRAQLDHFARAGWRCIAPDMRGYGGSSVPTATGDYSVRELVGDMIELHDALGGVPAVWIGHDWGSPVAWAVASHHPGRCKAVVNLCVPYFARGLALPNLLPLVDRLLYPADVFPVGQWDYFLFYRENFNQAAKDFEADIAAMISVLSQRGSADVISKPAMTADIRARGGWFGAVHRAPKMPPDETMLSQKDVDAYVAAFTATGFSGANSWYMNDNANLAFAAEAPNFGRLELPVLFLHAAWDSNCETVNSRLADPMRADCSDLTEVVIEAGHELMLEQPDKVNSEIEKWLSGKNVK